MPMRTCNGSGFELRQGLDQRKPGANRTLGVTLVGLRISKGDDTAVAHNELRAAAMIGADEVLECLRGPSAKLGGVGGQVRETR
jgi:hypothetical protein